MTLQEMLGKSGKNLVIEIHLEKVVVTLWSADGKTKEWADAGPHDGTVLSMFEKVEALTGACPHFDTNEVLLIG